MRKKDLPNIFLETHLQKRQTRWMFGPPPKKKKNFENEILRAAHIGSCDDNYKPPIKAL